jgi:hypothetical protein
MSDVKITRTWAMPSRHTFTIKPVANIIKKYSAGIKWVDPFSGWNSPAAYTNDLNPQAPTTSHADAQDFIKTFKSIDGMLFDPPYSPRQIAECYKGMGLKVGIKETQNATLYARVKDEAAPRIKKGGVVICCGWNSGGMGEKRGFELLEILLVAHGGAHNDTIVTVETKV